MQYTIQAVSPEVRNYDTKFGAMTSYKIKLNEHEGIVELSQKSSTPQPTVGQTLQGTIDMSGQFGPKFKKEFNQGGGFGSTPQASGATPSSAGTGTGNSENDKFTFYLSYAKDIATALIGSKEGYSDEQFSKILEDVLAGGEVLFDGRPGGKPAAQPAEEAKAKDNLPSDDVAGEPFDINQIPF